MTKIKTNVAALGEYARNVRIFINGEENRRCMEADEIEGVAWVLRGPEPRSAIFAKPGDYICEGAIVERKTGQVEIRFSLDAEVSEEVVRKQIATRYRPSQIIQSVQ